MASRPTTFFLDLLIFSCRPAVTGRPARSIRRPPSPFSTSSGVTDAWSRTFFLDSSGNFCRVSDIVPLRTQERSRAVDEAIRFLRGVKPLSPLVLSPGLCLAAADHCREQATGAIGHYGSNRTNPGERISRYGAFGQGWAENIAYGRHSARDIVIALIIDAGVPGRGHRKNIFNRTYDVAGAAYGPHAKFGSVCSIDFASGYSERTFVRAENDTDKTF